ncbi:GNAT family N-acetyltransferase [Catenuloplanes atrovinosus]|uniref:RimJ/RimL family protein N-acetyltransferase n=1 Tax=Catenuloplanes atrovinosus TaxID=137266 RepID=A0AAE3YPD6_9ACTN|nr:GNAT family protein [Catenuloplanes atrovinosus]MDR7276197.1 RimJ/RimL family protein N-acetyltransferase [Catenuloplanes atrovinosus]
MLQLRAVTAGDLPMMRRFAVEPGLIGPDWSGFRDAGAIDRRFAADGYLGGTPDSRLIVDVDGEAAGVVSFRACRFGGAPNWEIGIVLLPEWRGRGFGWRAQVLLCDYLFRHTPAMRISAGTQADNVPEQRALLKAGFQLEGTMRAIEFADGGWRDGMLYSRLRTDPAPALD